MSNYSVYQVMHDINYFEIFTIFLQVGLERVHSTRSLQQRLLSSESLKSAQEILNFINVNDRCLQQYLRQEKQRVEKESAMIEMLVNGGNKTKNSTHVMSFYHLSLKIINQWYPSFSVRVSLSGDLSDLAELYGQFFLLSGMAHRHQQVQAIKKNNLYEKVPYLSLLMKWLQEFCRSQFSNLFTQLYDAMTKFKANYVEFYIFMQVQASLKSSEVIMSPRVQKVAESEHKTTRPVSCYLKQRSTSSYIGTHIRRSSQICRKSSGIINKKISMKDLRNYFQPIIDILDIEMSHLEQAYYLQRKLSQPNKLHEQTQNHLSLYNYMLQRNQAIRNTRNNYFQQSHSQAKQSMKPLLTQFHYYTPQVRRIDQSFIRDDSFFNQ